MNLMMENNGMRDIVERLRNRALAAAIIKDKPDLYNDAADAIMRLCERLAEADEANRRVSDESEKLRLELDMQQATILVPSQKDDQRRIERLNSALAEALNEAAALRAENERLRKALKPFAEIAHPYKPHIYDDSHELRIHLGDLRAAAAALKESGDE